jgi:SAM-dependent methyltransferase
MNKKRLLKQVWNKKNQYYDLGPHSISILKGLYEFRTLQSYQIKAKKILELGCGDGKMSYILGKIIKGVEQQVGIDISPLAIKDAKKRYPKIHFFTGDAENLKLKEKFDFVCSFYTFEHLDNPEKVLKQMTNLLTPNGFIFIVCPNYGSPIYPSPVFRGNFITRLVMGINRDIKLLLNDKTPNLLWNKVEPIIDQGDEHVYDHDTTVEPYIFSLKKRIESFRSFKIILASSGWETVTQSRVSKKYWLFSLPFQFLANLNFFTFKYWGPICLVLVKRID